MNTPPLPPFGHGLIGKVKDILRRAHRLSRDQARLEEQAYHLWLALSQLFEAFGVPGSTGEKASGQNPLPSSASAQQQTLQQEAKDGIDYIRWTRLANGGAIVRLVDREQVELTQELAVLLQILIQDNGGGADKLVPWKSPGLLADGLKTHMGKRFSAGAVRQLIYRLRDEFRNFGENYLLVASVRGYGYRFALRRGPTNVIFDDHKSFPA